MVLSGVIFDLDGTLGETLPVCFAAFRIVFDEFLGVAYSDEEIRSMFGPTEEGMLGSRIVDGEAAVERYLKEYAAHHHLVPAPFPGVVALLDRLRAEATPVAVVTGKGPRSAAMSLEEWGIADRFTHVMAGGYEGNVKARAMEEVAAAWGADPATVVSVGDVASDVSHGRSAGLIPVGAAWSDGVDPAVLAAAAPQAVFTAVADFDRWLADLKS